MSTEDKIYMLRRQIENAAYDLLSLEFSLDDLEDFFAQIIEDVRADQEGPDWEEVDE